MAIRLRRRTAVAGSWPCCESGTTGVAGHFADEVLGRVVLGADGRTTWEPVA